MSETSLVYLVDDEALVRRGLSRLLRGAGFAVEAFASPKEFFDACDKQAADCVLLDLAMPGASGLDIQQTLVARGSDLPIVFLTGRADVPMSVQAMKNGAVDFLTKPPNRHDLVAAIQKAIEKGKRTRQKSAEVQDILARLATLTPREREVLEHVVTGQLSKQIAGDLGTVEQTIKVHRARVMEKMRVQSVAELVRMMERVRAD